MDNLYGQRPAKKPRRELPLSDTLDFASQLRSLITKKPKTTTTTTTTSSPTPLVFADPAARPPRDDLANVRVKKRKPTSSAETEAKAEAPEPNRLRLKAPTALDAADRERIRRSMQAKARRYAALKRGDDVARESDLVEFENENEEQSDSEHSSSSDDSPLCEYVDEFGRTRHMSRKARDRAERRRAAAERAARELEEMRARPAAPAVLLHGDVIQSEAIEVAPAPAPDPEEGDTHYRADEDIRTRGAAFYAFATDDEEARAAQMQALADARTNTEAARAQHTQHADARQQQMHERRRLMDERRRQLAERRAHRMADNFLQGLELTETKGEDRAEVKDTKLGPQDKSEVA